MEKEVLYKNNPTIEGKKRLNMAYLLLKNPEMVEIIEKTKGNFFHGTNANALPNILEYGLNSVNKSVENNIDVVTGEEWSRINGKRAFVSLTDCLDVAIKYADKNKCENISNSLLNFGVIIGASFENMQNLNVTSIQSDISEIGVMGNLPLENIKYLAVPEDKVEFVKKMVGQKNIAVVAIDMKDKYYSMNYIDKMNSLEHGKEEQQHLSELIYSKQDMKEMTKTRRTTKIKEIFSLLKEKIYNKNKQKESKDKDER